MFKNNEPIDYLPDGMELSDRVIDAYKNLCLIKVEFDLFANSLKTFGKPDEDLLRRYIMQEITLWDIADERKIAYETAKGKIRDLKKTLKMRTIPCLV